MQANVALDRAAKDRIFRLFLVLLPAVFLSRSTPRVYRRRHQVRQDFLADDRKSGSLSGLPMFYGYRRLNKLLVPRVEDAIKPCVA